MRHVFGWSLPPGVTNGMIEAAFGEESPCACCARDITTCICPECPVCRVQGDPACYAATGHGLVYTDEQRANLAAAEAEMHAESAEIDRQYENEWTEECFARASCDGDLTNAIGWASRFRARE